jgi:hypothetical protein
VNKLLTVFLSQNPSVSSYIGGVNIFGLMPRRGQNNQKPTICTIFLVKNGPPATAQATIHPMRDKLANEDESAKAQCQHVTTVLWDYCLKCLKGDTVVMLRARTENT